MPIHTVSDFLSLILRLKLHYSVFDSTGSISVVFWDRLAVQLLNKTASQLKFLIKEVIIVALFQDYLLLFVN